MKKTSKRILSLMFAALMTVTLVSVNAFAEESSGSPTAVNKVLNEYAAMESNKGDKGYVTVNDTQLTDLSNVTLNYGDKIGVQMYWNFDNTDHEFAAGSTFAYTLPGGIDYSVDGAEASGPVYDGSKQVGNYAISGTTLTITYTDSDFCSESDREGSLNLSGTITSASYGGKDGGDISFEFPGIGTVKGTLNRDSGSDAVTVEKTAVGHTGLDYTFLLKITASGPQTKVTVTDTMGSYLTLTADSVKFYTDESCTTAYEGTVTPNTIENLNGFSYTIDSMSDQQVLYVQYHAALNRSAYTDLSNNNQTLKDARTNTVEVVSDTDTDPDKKSVTLDISKTWKNKTGIASKDGKTITWTIDVNYAGDEVDLQGSIIKDTLGANQTYNNDLKIAEAVYNSETYTNSTLDLTWEKLTSADGYTFGSTTKKYRIVYSTTVTGNTMNINTYTNKVDFNVFGEQQWSQTASVDIGSGWNYIDKEFSSVSINNQNTPDDASDDTTVFQWKITVHVPEGGITGLQIDDRIPQFFTYVDNSLTLTNENFSGTISINYTKNDSSFVNRKHYLITFGDSSTVTPAGDYVLTMQIERDTDDLNSLGSTTYYNDVWLKNGSNQTLEHTWAYHQYDTAQYLSKSYVSSADGKMNWNLTVQKLPQDTQNTVITDTLPDNVTFDKDSIKLSGSGTEGMESHLTAEQTGNTVKFTLDQDLIDKAETGAFVISYSVSVNFTEATEGKQDYTNTAQIKVDDLTCPIVTAKGSYTREETLSKSYTYTSATAPYAYYSITVNPDSLDLDSESKTITLSDTMGSALDFDFNSLKIDGVSASSESYSFDSNTRTMTIPLSDSASHTITYRALVNLEVGSQFPEDSAVNSCTLKGSRQTAASDSTEITGTVLKSAATSTSNGVAITIYKYGDTETESLSNAKFTVYHCTLSADHKTVVSTSALSSKSYVTDQGYVTVSGLNRDTVYKIVETEAPDGYVLNSTPIYAVFAGSDGIDWETISEVTENGTAYQLNLGGNTQSSLQVSLSNSSRVSIVKQDVLGNALTGAELTLYSTYDAENPENNVAVKNWTTDGTEKNIPLTQGVYTLAETKAPDGFAIADLIAITVNEDGTVTSEPDVITEQDGRYTVTMTDEAVHEGSIVITKHSETENGTVLSGASYVVYKNNSRLARTADLNYVQIVNGEVSYTESESQATVFTTDSNGRAEVTGLAAGVYYFVEVSAPDGYIVDSSPIQIVVNRANASDANLSAETLQTDEKAPTEDKTTPKTPDSPEVIKTYRIPNTVDKD